MPDDIDDRMIEAVVEDYFRGMYERDLDRLRAIFHPQCWLFGENPRGSHAFPVAGFLEQIEASPCARDEGEPYEMRLVSLDRTGPVAVAKLSVLYLGRRFTDYLALQRTADGWKVVGKLFYSED